MKKVKTMDFSDTIAACDLKLIELMKICEYMKIKPAFLSNHWAFFSQILNVYKLVDTMK